MAWPTPNQHDRNIVAKVRACVCAWARGGEAGGRDGESESVCAGERVVLEGLHPGGGLATLNELYRIKAAKVHMYVCICMRVGAVCECGCVCRYVDCV